MWRGDVVFWVPPVPYDFWQGSILCQICCSDFLSTDQQLFCDGGSSRIAARYCFGNSTSRTAAMTQGNGWQGLNSVLGAFLAFLHLLARALFVSASCPCELQ